MIRTLKKLITVAQLKIHYSNRKKYFDRLFCKEDPYLALTNEYESVKFGWVLDCVKDRLYAEALELGCAEGLMTVLLAPYCGRVLGVDISSTAPAPAVLAN